MGYPASAYTIQVREIDPATTVVADVPISALSFSKTLNSPGAATLTLPMTSVARSNMRVLKHRVRVLEDGNLRWGGDIWGMSLDTKAQMMDVRALGYFERLRHRQFEQNLFYNGVEQFTIAWGLLDYTQGATVATGNLFITDGGAAASGITRKRHYCAWDSGSIADAIEDLSMAPDGFDFEISDNLVWNVYDGYRGVVTPVKTFTLGDSPDDASNIDDLSLTDDGDDAANYIAGKPDDECLDVSDFVIEPDSSSVSMYGPMHDVVDLPNISEKSERIGFLQEELRNRRYSKRQIVITTPDMPWDSPGFEVGDNIAVTADLGYVTLTAEVFRVITWEVHVMNGTEWSVLTCDSEVLT